MIYSKFYYDLNVTWDNLYLTFREGAEVLTASLIPSSYSHQKICFEIARAMSEIGQNDYWCTLDRTTRTITINGTGDFELLVAEGDNPNFGQAIYSEIGFTTTRTAGTSHIADLAAGSAFCPQFTLQKYVDPEDTLEAMNASINEAGGSYEVVSFGKKRSMRCEIKHITNKEMGGAIENNPQGVEDARKFMEALIDKPQIEFMFDRDKPNEFYTVVLEKTRKSNKGVGYELYKDRKFIGHYTTADLTFRVIDKNGVKI